MMGVKISQHGQKLVAAAIVVTVIAMFAGAFVTFPSAPEEIVRQGVAS